MLGGEDEMKAMDLLSAMEEMIENIDLINSKLSQRIYDCKTEIQNETRAKISKLELHYYQKMHTRYLVYEK